MPKLNQDSLQKIDFTLNGVAETGTAEPRMLLSDFLRNVMGVTGCHVGCEHGVCGACTVQIDGKAQRSCLTLAVQVAGRKVDTVESLAGRENPLTDLQQAFKTHHGLQCGYCTPGILMSTSEFLDRNPNPTEEEVRDMLSGHLCRCTGYAGIVNAIMATIEERQGKAAAE
ncbi:MAG: (2Fe-2S)-binding protein [Rhodospirillaceae bacterium]|jgi:2-furoyl-CoA dehydrogenase 2Fe-2S iron sulfur subunit|nr:(2Fe-2S)-binding protein [Rhodospirillaceae bacterium]MBT5940319.1 (2Fe-2S)-binding protein [Rhodospirillaceae bacterium]MBT7267870.1 (2Fe-2S)-binding protein [Rhodospirillaceae bacterium]